MNKIGKMKWWFILLSLMAAFLLWESEGPKSNRILHVVAGLGLLIVAYAMLLKAAHQKW